MPMTAMQKSVKYSSCIPDSGQIDDLRTWRISNHLPKNPAATKSRCWIIWAIAAAVILPNFLSDSTLSWRRIVQQEQEQASSFVPAEEHALADRETSTKPSVASVLHGPPRPNYYSFSLAMHKSRLLEWTCNDLQACECRILYKYL